MSGFWSIVAQHLISFAGGLILGFFAANRYRLERRSKEET